MQWWHWAVLGVLLALLELASPGGFFIIFFGAGAMIVALLAVLGIAGPLWVQWLLFSALSVGALVLFRDPLLRKIRQSTPTHRVDALTADVAIASDDLPPGAVGRAELRGSAWSARNVGSSTIVKGQRCAVRRVEGLMLHITGEGV